jgi:hypothetical protein
MWCEDQKWKINQTKENEMQFANPDEGQSVKQVTPSSIFTPPNQPKWGERYEFVTSYRQGVLIKADNDELWYAVPMSPLG